MSKVPVWTDEEKDLMRKRYADIGPAAMSLLVKHSPKACQEKAVQMELRMTKEALSALRSRRKVGVSASRPDKPRVPFDGIQDEFIKVSSIWRVGSRYLAQVAA